MRMKKNNSFKWGIILLFIIFLSYTGMYMASLYENDFEGNVQMQSILLSLISIICRLLAAFILPFVVYLCSTKTYIKRIYIIYIIDLLIELLISSFIGPFYEGVAFTSAFLFILVVYDLLGGKNDEILDKYFCKCSNCGALVDMNASKCPKCKESFDEDSNDFETKYDELKKLKELYDEEILSREEFEFEKKKILKHDTNQVLEQSYTENEIISDEKSRKLEKLEKYNLDFFSGMILAHALTQQRHGYIITQDYDIDKNEVEYTNCGYIIGLAALLLNIYKKNIQLDKFINYAVHNAEEILNVEAQKYIPIIKKSAMKCKDFLIDNYSDLDMNDDLMKKLTEIYLEDLNVSDEKNNYNEYFDMAFGDLKHYYEQTKNIIDKVIITD